MTNTNTHIINTSSKAYSLRLFIRVEILLHGSSENCWWIEVASPSVGRRSESENLKECIPDKKDICLNVLRFTYCVNKEQGQEIEEFFADKFTWKYDENSHSVLHSLNSFGLCTKNKYANSIHEFTLFLLATGRRCLFSQSGSTPPKGRRSTVKKRPYKSLHLRNDSWILCFIVEVWKYSWDIDHLSGTTTALPFYVGQFDHFVWPILYHIVILTTLSMDFGISNQWQIKFRLISIIIVTIDDLFKCWLHLFF